MGCSNCKKKESRDKILKTLEIDDKSLAYITIGIFGLAIYGFFSLLIDLFHLFL
jgi:hypothetical protein